ncbi:hypothetical protein ONV75_08805 [Clostridium sp. LQ25]|uniref:hypothetical protein n=1 Tax=Clostridium TaxID=1485 RepID=UPI0005EAFCF9|nr:MULTISPECIES: hypothetical protein [Clostridium]MDU3583245.1 hypothetical protein [Clostridium butyricum]MDU3596534.1 hypothetical protein [Clostridium butyricum]UZT07955.1 hypothetical protein ONV75_08805 [Clostridium sp. LQ25]
MSAEIGIINKYGIALATDSAVTVADGQGCYTTANKLFALSKFEPVAIMIYSNADYMGVPVEIIIKEYRKELKETKFNTLKEYWNDFVNYLQKFSQKRIKNCKQYLLDEMVNFLEFVKVSIDEQLDCYYDEIEDPLKKDELNDKIIEIRKQVIESFYKSYSDMDDDIEFIEIIQKIEEELNNDLKNIINEKFGIDLEEDNINNLLKCCVMILTKRNCLGNRTGIVIAGYGDDEIFPTLISGEFLGYYFGKIKYIVTQESNLEECESAICPFAQADVVNAFITGIDNSIIEEIMNTIDNSKSFSKCTDNENCKNKLKNELYDTIERASNEYHINPIVNTISSAPKEEMAQMAETLVNITSFRRRLSFDKYSQTVGGPIDVLVITKGDGLVWLKRKHYFDKALNNSFFHNYYK